MKTKLLAGAALAAAAIFAGPIPAASPTAAAVPAGRQITAPIDDSIRVTLPGNTRPEARIKSFDRGPVADSFPLPHLQLLLKRSAAQEKSLEELIDQLHDPKSPNFHHWMTAAELGQEYGVAGADMQTITGWLKSHGFAVNIIYSNAVMIDFSGTAGQVRDAFETEIHNLNVNGAPHMANVSDPQIPSALAPAVAGIVSLNDFRPKPMVKPRPKYTYAPGGFNQLVVPADLETIYNMNPLYPQGISGQGQTIVVLEGSNVYSTADYWKFRATFGLDKYKGGTFNQVHPNTRSGFNCVDPGVNSDDFDSILDAEYASAVAPNAHIVLASCQGNFFIALQNMLDGANPPAIVSASYGDCEAYLGATRNAYVNALFQQAVAEGTSVYVSAGDEGAASCDNDDAAAWQGISVSGLASTPYNVAVGGTDFGDSYAGTNSSYWSAINSPTYESALSYVPEVPWNDSCASALSSTYLTGGPPYGASGFCNTALGQEFWTDVGGSGGPSGCAFGATSTSAAAVSGTCSGYAKPAFQRGLKGNPSDGARDIPDVSLFAGNGFLGHYFIICYSDPHYGYGVPCTGSPANWAGGGGTSFSSPIFAGIQALVNQKTGARWGNPNYVFYALAQKQFTGATAGQCNSSLGNKVSKSCMFYDVTQGDMDVNCTSAQALGYTNIGLTYLGPVNCYIPSGFMGVLSTSNNKYQPAYPAGSGWDFATGLGSPNVANLVNAWPPPV